MGFRQFRVRYHGETARIELATEEFSRLLDEARRTAIVAQIQACGFKWVTLDLAGYRPGGAGRSNGELLPLHRSDDAK